MERSKTFEFLFFIVCIVVCLSSAAAATPPGTLSNSSHAVLIDSVHFHSGDGMKDLVSEADPDPLEGESVTDKPYVPGSVIVVYEEPGMAAADTGSTFSATANAGIGATVTDSYVRGVLPGCQVVSLPESVTVDEAVIYYARLPGVKYAEPDYIRLPDAAPNDPLYAEQWGLKNTGQTTPHFPSGGTTGADIGTEDAWDVTTGSEEVVIAVIGGGVDYLHEDLVANMWDDGSGHCGYDFVYDTNDPMDDSGHGTRCAGVIAAAGDNDIGITGVCWNAQIMALKIIDADGQYSVSDEIAAIEYAVTHGADILSCSYGGSDFSVSEKEAFGNSGLLAVCSAGNAGDNTDTDPHYPASLDCPNIIAVAATAPDDTLAIFESGASNYGATSVDLGAPGLDISCAICDVEYGEMGETVFSDDMSTTSNWFERDFTGNNRSVWHLDTTTYTSPPSSAASGSIGSFWNQFIITKDYVSLEGLSHPGMKYNWSVSTRIGYSQANMNIWQEGNSYPSQISLTQGTTGGFKEINHDLDSFVGKKILIGFGVLCNAAPFGSGLWVDDVQVGQLEASERISRYEYFSGTSMSAAMVSGAAGLVIAAHPDYTWQEVKAELLENTDRVPALTGKCVTGGRLNAYPGEPDPLDAEFCADTTSGTSPLTVQFTDTSSGSPTGWTWDFGDGATSTESDPTNIYKDMGTYTVSLTVEDAEGNHDTETKDGFINVSSGTTPLIRFTPPSSVINMGTDGVYSFVLDHVPAGLADYNLTLYLSNPEAGEIVGISPPFWATQSATSAVPDDMVWISCEDSGSSVNPGETDVTLGTITVRGDTEDMTEIIIVVDRMHDDFGNMIIPIIEPATITVNIMEPFPGFSNSPTDPDDDGKFEDINGNGRIDFADVVTFFKEMDWISDRALTAFFDFNSNGRIDFDDVVKLFREL